ncbi:DUF3679 domain-containing protein [Aquibacillus kalidii]|uniref:DUF3679 domain-containing protein n=1 Tax=Aquibacillus kalidii TaxID=2762597 RepID=UPI001647868B|nr:DUF3679 domain-containing protein [Aquibacillus kalidii]
MGKMIMTALTMLVLFLGGVLFGIEQANEGVLQTRGYSSDLEEAVKSEVTEGGSYEVEVMGKKFEQVDMDKKEQQYEEIESNHLMQKVATNLESGVKWFYNQVIHSAYQLSQAFF